jgi:hypothetical protein
MSENQDRRSPDDLAREEEEKQNDLNDPAIKAEIDEKYVGHQDIALCRARTHLWQVPK